jgi:hypothetical protein
MTLPDLTFGTGRTIGRYFSIVSVVPSALLVLFIFVLVHSGAWTGTPDWKLAASAVGHINIADAFALGILSVAAALALQPLQFAIVQIFEGYWGVSALAKDLRAARTTVHRQRLLDLESAANRPVIRAGDRSGGRLGDEVWQRSAKNEAARARNAYPRNLSDVMPTRLGNVLRRYEMGVGSSYGLSPLKAVPYLALVAPIEHVQYLDDQRSQLDLAVRMSFTSMLATVTAVLFLWRDGLWLIVAAATYGLAYLFYRGAVVTAREYGTAIATLVDLNRFTLYERLHLPLPKDINEELQLNEQIAAMMDFDRITDMTYKHPDLSSTPNKMRRTLISRFVGALFRRT